MGVERGIEGDRKIVQELKPSFPRFTPAEVPVRFWNGDSQLPGSTPCTGQCLVPWTTPWSSNHLQEGRWRKVREGEMVREGDEGRVMRSREEESR